MICFECESPDNLHMHHVVPRSLGGTKMIPLCGACHSLVHSAELTNNRKLTRDALREKKARGERVGAIPYGFRVDADGSTLIRDEYEQDVIRVAVELRGIRRTYRWIAEALTERGYAPRSGGRWYETQVYRMTKNQSDEATP